MNYRNRAPLVSTSLEDASEKMLSEGLSVIDPETFAHQVSELHLQPPAPLEDLKRHFQKHPWLGLTCAAILGSLIGSCLSITRHQQN